MQWNNGSKGLAHSLEGTRGEITRKGRDSEEICEGVQDLIPLLGGTLSSTPFAYRAELCCGAG